MDGSDSNTKRLITGIALILLLYVIAVPFYIYVEGFSLVEAVYFVTVTITTVGYGDITPKTTAGRLFTVALLLSGVSIFFYHVTHFGLFKEKTIDPHVQRRLEVLRSLTALQTGEVKKDEIKKIKEKMQKDRGGERQGFGKL
jgi:voltage-gated potassium channel